MTASTALADAESTATATSPPARRRAVWSRWSHRAMAFAQTAKEKELEARVAQLEAAWSSSWSSQQQQQQSQISEAQTAQVTEVKTAQAQRRSRRRDTGKPTIQTAPIMATANPGHARSPTAASSRSTRMVTETNDGDIADGSSGRLFYVPSAIPVGGGTADGGDAVHRFHAQFSRFWFSADHRHRQRRQDQGLHRSSTCSVAAAPPSSRQRDRRPTPTPLSLRQAYVQLEQLAGRPDLVQLPGHRGAARCGRLRRPHGRHRSSCARPSCATPRARGRSRWRTRRPRCHAVQRRHALQSPATTLVPDFTARWLTKGDWGHFSVAGLVRQCVPERPGQHRNRHRLRRQRVGQVQPGQERRHPLHGQRRQRHRPLPRPSASATTWCSTPTATSTALDGLRRLRRLAPCVQSEAAHNLIYSRARLRQRHRPHRLRRHRTRRSRAHANLIYSPFPSSTSAPN